MKKIGSILFVITLVFFMGCSGKKEEFAAHKSGFKYLPIDRSDVGLSPRIGDLATLRISIKAPNDSVIKRADFFRIQIKESQYKGGINQALRFMHEGDSIAFLIDAINYFRYDEQVNVPEYIKQGDKLRFDIRLSDVKSMEELEKERQIKKISGKRREIIALKHFLGRVGLEDSARLDKIFIKKLEPGTGKKPKTGDRVYIDYLGYFVDGNSFDNTYERGRPFTFTLGANKAIEGLEMGVKKMRVGGKATIIIPSPLAYGDQGLPRANIAPHTTLVFDVELVKVQ